MRGLLLLAVVALSACTVKTKVDKVESVRDQSYTASPKIISIIEGKNVDFPQVMRANIVAGLQACGVTGQFFPFNNFKNEDFYKKSDSTLQANILNSDATTRSNLGYSSTYMSRATYEFTLLDNKSQKNVWRARMDFQQPDPGDNFNNQMRGEHSPAEVWAAGLLSQMKKDGLLGACSP